MFMPEKPMLLIVDDEKPTREGLRAALEDRYDVYLAEDAKSAIDLLEREHFSVLLTDFRLPSEDGMKLIARAKSLSMPMASPVDFISGPKITSTPGKRAK